MKPMLLTTAEKVPPSEDWLYEVKYDGYRCLLKWDEEGITLLSRNGKVLNDYFPEIIDFCNERRESFLPFLPLLLDGEIVYLLNDYRSNFSTVQARGKMRSVQTILQASTQFPCTYIAFDLLQLKDGDLFQRPLLERKEDLLILFQTCGLPLQPSHKKSGTLQLIEYFNAEEPLWAKVQECNGEGLIAKKKNSIWESGKRSNVWLKVKNWRYVTVILTLFDQANGYFNGAVFADETLQDVTTFRHGLTDEEMQTLSAFFRAKGTKISSAAWTLPPSICVDVACIDFDGKKLREPRFEKFRFEFSPLEATWKNMLRQLNPVPSEIEITHPDKPVFPSLGFVKDDYIYYLQEVSPYLLPFLENRCLTSIRFPHGVPGESFYQKNIPDYAPDFIHTKREEDIDYIICNDIKTLLWLGNQLAIEFHIPFRTTDTERPTEIVFDLDPPSVDEFSLAVEAAIQMKAIFDQFNLTSLIKTSGNKGLQIYIPLPKDTFTFEETRIFTEFVCKFLVSQNPKWFTIERMKRNRNNKLYLDYVQHAMGKTIISPYSARGNEHGLIATPLQWHEVNRQLHPALFTIPAVLERIKNKGDLFQEFQSIGKNQPFQEVLVTLKDLIHKK